MNAETGGGAYFPVFISLDGKHAAVIGAGKIGARRAGVLLSFGCSVTVIAPEAGEEMRKLLEVNGAGGVQKLTWLQEPFSEQLLKELHGMEPLTLLIAASSDREVNHAAGQAAKRLQIPANVADCRSECDFFFPGIARKGQVVVGVCASGADHRLARRVTERMREAIMEGE